MDIVGDRRFVEIPGDRMHELPPLLVHAGANVSRLDKVMEMATRIIESDDIIDREHLDPLASEIELERRRMDLALNLVDQYLALVSHWQWGDDVLEWVRQCEMTFDTKRELRNILRPDVWPHAGRSSFITLLTDKAVDTKGILLQKAIGLRLAFRQPPPITCFSDQFLFYLNSSVADVAFQKWSQMAPDPICSLPPERFCFHVYTM
jgi:hypothetical protein